MRRRGRGVFGVASRTETPCTSALFLRMLLLALSSLVLLLHLPESSVFVDAGAIAPGLLDPSTQSLFVTDVPNPLDPSYLYYPKEYLTEDYDDPTMYEQRISVAACRNDNHITGLVDEDGNTMYTPIYGYQDYDENGGGGDCLWPGKTFVVESYTSLFVKFENKIDMKDGYILTDINGERTVVDTSLHWSYSLDGYTGNDVEKTVPTVPHLHGGHTVCHADGNPEAFFGYDYEPFGPLAKSEWYPFENTQQAAALWYHGKNNKTKIVRRRWDCMYCVGPGTVHNNSFVVCFGAN